VKISDLITSVRFGPTDVDRLAIMKEAQKRMSDFYIPKVSKREILGGSTHPLISVVQ